MEESERRMVDTMDYGLLHLVSSLDRIFYVLNVGRFRLRSMGVPNLWHDSRLQLVD